MKSIILHAVLSSGLAQGAAVTAEVCRSKLQSTLAACSTGSAFCSSYLGYSSGSSHTFTEYTQTTSTVTYTKTKYIASSTSFVTTILYGVTTTSTLTTSVTVPTETATSPSGLTGSPTCYVSTLTESARGVSEAVKVAAKTSCGLKNKAASVLSTACSCYVDSHVTATNTITKTKTTKVTGVATVTLTRYHTSTTTSTSTSTVASTTTTVILPACPTPDSSCGNAGLQWAYYTAVSTSGSSPYDPGNNAGFDPSLYKNVTPVITGTTQLISIAYTSDGSGTAPFYGEGPEPVSNFVVDHKGYLYAPQTGNYSFFFDYVDDEGYIYLGPTAYSGWSLSNYNYTAYWGTANPGTLTVPLVQGQYVPLRVPFAQGTGAGGFGFDIVAPDGEYVMTSNAGLIASPYVVWRSCDNTTAPAFPVWGSET